MKAPKPTTNCICITITFLLLLLIIPWNTYSQQLAFPTAMGAGAYTTGGRGQSVYHVTNLNATGPGSFRDALSQSNRTIVFDVSGIIEMIPEFQGDDILIEANNLTIAGQTAPEGNITITGARLVFRGENVIVRYLKLRSTDDVEGVINSSNKSDVIFDHLSVSGVETNQVAIGMTTNPDTPAYNRTTQNCLIAYSGLGMIIGDTTPPNDTNNETYSIINNAFVFVGHRIPAKIAGAVHMDIINNLSHGHSARLIRIDDWSYNLNHVGNYYTQGRPMDQLNTAYYGTRNGLIYDNDNYYDPDFTQPDEWERFLGDEAPLPSSKFVQSPFTYQNSETLNILSSGDLKTQMLPFVGCYKYINDNGQVIEDRDSIDSQAIDDATNETTRGSVSDFINITIDDIPTSNNTRPVDFYQSNPHIPEAWLVSQGISGNADIHNQIQQSGYTLLEEYFNQVDSMGNVEATGLNITPDVATLNVSETIDLDVQFTPANTTDQSGVWTSENEEIANVDTNGTVTGIAEGVVEIRFVSNDGGFTDTSVITVVPLPVVADAGEDQNICEGESVLLTATGGTNFLWSTGETTQSITVSPNSTTTYSVTVSNGTEEDTDDVTVFVDTLPNLTISDDVTIIEGDNTTLTAEGANEYLWNTGETTSSITVSPNVTTTYTVTGSNGSCEVQEQIIVTVEAIFQADAGEDQRICDGSGDEVILSAGEGDAYLWSTGETTQNITVSPESTTTYSVVVTNGSQEDSDSVTVFVDPNPNVVIVNGDSVDILSGDFITLSATGANSYEWSNGATQPNIAISPSVTTTYEVRGYINDCYDEKQVTVNVFEPVVAYAGEDISICLNEVATLTATGGDEYLWSTGETTQSIQVSPFQTTVYTVTVFNALDFDEASVTVEIDNFCEEEESNNQNDEVIDMSFKVYPNPAYNYVNVRLDGSMNLINVFIYDFTGKLVQQTEIQNESQSPIVETRMNIQSLSNGIYFVKLVNKSGDDITRKLIVR
ncbi:Ig-like domain-containing protein [Winogradskyella alexanderae]|uniref:Ig-like domain-containing protein n=1 Tax=Winogradskyella alexanderae TaxID=2877123 RepID=A0ABS7XUV0_9FLAO|nr:Ig-like domain-containing protein [Winogradskyella alexanderae]MCA0132697.1 Ig-like domain-containing protein [Winogradskyella alexanderae]